MSKEFIQEKCYSKVHPVEKAREGAGNQHSNSIAQAGTGGPKLNRNGSPGDGLWRETHGDAGQGQ